ncbi:uncharacterized protein LOC132946338 [Metopolophium dirhodum]|uniref:uncharacterized protein LOC132946338 n=1 Tax=Metopolophium dirhodum TaxID=44670 RepID=UPI0029902B02|nr:uncharacterized protein LOC132946338 [Metopolophium dirhodum]
MAAEKYLMQLEANRLLNEVEQTPPPKMSNFYWKNYAGHKYKAFIPTPNRRMYYNLEEYEGDMNINEFDNNRWTSAKKCVLLAVSNTHPADKSFINHMDFLIANLYEWYERNNELLSNIGGDVEDLNANLYKHYVINKYLVDDIQNIPMELRGKHADFRSTITIHPALDEARIIYAMNMGFKLAAKRFANDQNRGVYAYGRHDHGFSYY